MKTRISITGGAGFLGRHLVNLLAKNKNYEIILLARSVKKYSKYFSKHSHIGFHKGDLLKPESLVGFLTKDTVLINLAYLKSDPSGNLNATNNLIKAANEASIPQVIHCSTAVVVGFSSIKFVNESTPLEPKGIYQINKAVIEKLFDHNLSPSIPLQIIRPTEIIGVDSKSVIHKMIDKFKSPRVIYQFYNFLLSNRRFNLVSVHNVSSAIEFLLNKNIKSPRNIYIISDDGDVDNNYKNIFNIIRIYMGSSTSIFLKFGLPIYLLEYIFVFFKRHSPPNRIYCNGNILQLGFKPKVSIAQATNEILFFTLKYPKNSIQR
tara:strand:- start:1931 stop:2890 length:960 start_codon:yes stop_codon:yes gene_type:complete